MTEYIACFIFLKFLVYIVFNGVFFGRRTRCTNRIENNQFHLFYLFIRVNEVFFVSVWLYIDEYSFVPLPLLNKLLKILSIKLNAQQQQHQMCEIINDSVNEKYSFELSICSFISWMLWFGFLHAIRFLISFINFSGYLYGYIARGILYLVKVWTIALSNFHIISIDWQSSELN